VKVQPLLSERSRNEQILFAVIVPILFGTLAGYFLGVSKTTYLILSVIAFIGGIGAGFDHAGAAAGAKRGLLGGTLFGAAILITHEIHGADAKTSLPDPGILLVVVTAVLGAALGAVGGAVRARYMRRTETAETHP
jgi:hypothetical protein